MLLASVCFKFGFRNVFKINKSEVDGLYFVHGFGARICQDRDF